MITDRVEDKILLSPFCGNAIEVNPLKQASRNFPIDMIYKQSIRFKTTIHIPDGVMVKPFKENVVIANEVIAIQYVSTIMDKNTVVIQGNYSFLKEVYEASEYA